MAAHTQPLAARMRPISLDEVVGQDHLLGPGSVLRSLAAATGAVSVMLWGPPGTGKTSMAQAIAASTLQRFVELSATSAGVKEVRQAITDAQKALDEDQRTVLFVDEIHRFTKAQQDILLPAVEQGTVSLVGATTENPSFSVISALLSRSVLQVLRPLEDHQIASLLGRALDDPRGFDGRFSAQGHVLDAIAAISSGDARQALTRLETAATVAQAAGGTEITRAIVEQVAGVALQRYDRDGDQHYDVISAFIKSMRGSDPQAALHWLARMIEAGEDPRYIARRIVVHASEDVGMADPQVLLIAVAAAQAVQLIGMPEARINLAQAVIAVATAPKSPAVCAAIDAAITDVKRGRTGEVPMPMRDAHYPGAAALGHGKGYLFPHDFQFGVVKQQYLPDKARGAVYYEPTDHGYERTIAARMDAFATINERGERT